MRSMLTSACFITPCVLALCGSVFAQPWATNGVITQGIFHTSDNNIYGQSADDVSFDFTEVSLNGSYRSPVNARLSGQVIYRHAGAQFDDVAIDYLNVDAQLTNNDNHAGGLRGGRVKVPYGLFNESRDVAFTRPSIYLSQSIYFDLTMRETLVSADGFFPYLSLFSDAGRWDIELGFGQPKAANFDTLQVLGERGDYTLEEAALYRILYTSPMASVQAAISGIYADDIIYTNSFDIRDFGISPINIGGATIDSIELDASFKSHLTVLSVQYAIQSYTFTLEYGTIKVDTKSVNVSVGGFFARLVQQELPELLAGINVRTESIYAQIEKRFNRQWAVNLYIDHLYSDRDDREGELVEANRLGRGYSRFAKAAGLGVHWTPRWNISVRAEVHYIDGTAWLNDQENANSSGESEQYWHAAAISCSYRF